MAAWMAISGQSSTSVQAPLRLSARAGANGPVRIRATTATANFATAARTAAPDLIIAFIFEQFVYEAGQRLNACPVTLRSQIGVSIKNKDLGRVRYRVVVVPVYVTLEERNCERSCECLDPAIVASQPDEIWRIEANERPEHGRRVALRIDADQNRLDLRGAVDAGRDCVIDVNVVMQGPVRLGDNVHVGANCLLENVCIGANVSIMANTVIEDAVIGEGAMIGPFARIRPGTRLAEGVHVGNFVELKNADLAAGAKVNHLSYIGDSTVGAHANVGAGVITCNYDGARKHRTVIGDDAFVGSNAQLVAPVEIGAGATVGAGSTITQDVPAGTLAVSRGRQRHIEDWKRPGKK